MQIIKGGPRDVMANVLDCSLHVSEFEFQSHYVRFRTLEKILTPLSTQQDIG